MNAPGLTIRRVFLWIHALSPLGWSATNETIERIVVALAQLTNQVAVGEFDVVDAVGTLSPKSLLAEIDRRLYRTQRAQLIRRRKPHGLSLRIDGFHRRALRHLLEQSREQA